MEVTTQVIAALKQMVNLNLTTVWSNDKSDRPRMLHSRLSIYCQPRKRKCKFSKASASSTHLADKSGPLLFHHHVNRFRETDEKARGGAEGEG